MKRLVLLGGGHAHVHVLDALRAQPRPDVEVTLVSPYPRQVYSGMLPGWIAGHYSLDECVLPLDRLAADAQVRFVQQKGIGLDLAAKQLQCSDGQTMDFDVISIDTGPVTDTRMVPGAAEHALPIRPIERFISGWQRWLETLGEAGSPAIAIVGGGAAGVELALAMRYRLELDRAARHIPIHLVSSQPEPLAGMPAVLRKAVSRLLAERRIDWLGGRRAIHYNGRTLCLSGGGRVPATHCLLVPGAAAPVWPATSGLATDPSGFITVRPTLQSTSHPYVFAAGDIAAYADPRPKSGVFAVRAGPPLAANLNLFLDGEPLQAWKAQRRALYLISTGKRHALAAWGPFAWRGDWVWRWKDRIDRDFVKRFTPIEGG